MSAGVERTPNDDGPQSIGVAEMKDGDIVLYDKDNPAGFIHADPAVVIDLTEVGER